MNGESKINDASAMKVRMRTDLRSAMKDGDRTKVGLIRSLIAALDNAEAVPLEDNGAGFHTFGSGSAEADRLWLDDESVQRVLLHEIAEREEAAAQFERLGHLAAAQDKRAEAELARHYLSA